VNYREEAAQFPELGELEPFSAAWYWTWACAMVAAYPTLDPRTCHNLLSLAEATR
jgi:hypothetical protein